jgi:hypothetical protein
MESNMATKPVEGEAFEVHVKGVATGKTWDGKFRAKPLLTFREQMLADKMRREFTGTDVQDPDIVAQATIISELAFRLTEVPEWWRSNGGGLDLSDPNVLTEVYREAKKVEEDHAKSLTAEGEAARQSIKGLLDGK